MEDFWIWIWIGRLCTAWYSLSFLSTVALQILKILNHELLDRVLLFAGGVRHPSHENIQRVQPATRHLGQGAARGGGQQSRDQAGGGGGQATGQGSGQSTR